MLAHRYDAIIIRGRCAGAATAMFMARNGMKVLIAERGAPGILGTQRTIFDKTLVAAARETGADVRFHTSFRDVIHDKTGRLTGAVLTDETGIDTRVEARLLVGADDFRSTVARKVGAAVRKEARHALDQIYGYALDLPLAGDHAFLRQASRLPRRPQMAATW